MLPHTQLPQPVSYGAPFGFLRPTGLPTSLRRTVRKPIWLTGGRRRSRRQGRSPLQPQRPANTLTRPCQPRRAPAFTPPPRLLAPPRFRPHEAPWPCGLRVRCFSGFGAGVASFTAPLRFIHYTLFRHNILCFLRLKNPLMVYSPGFPHRCDSVEKPARHVYGP